MGSLQGSTKGVSMRELAFLLIMACALVAGLGASTAKPFDYSSAWKEIEKLQNDGLPKSMAAKVDSLYAAALREQKTDQIRLQRFHMAAWFRTLWRDC